MRVARCLAVLGSRTYLPNCAKQPDAEDDDDHDDGNINDAFCYSVSVPSTSSGTAGRSKPLRQPLAWPKDVPAIGQLPSKTLPSSPTASSRLDARPLPDDASLPSQTLISSLAPLPTRRAVPLHSPPAPSSSPSISTSVGSPLVFSPNASTICAMLLTATM